MRKVRINLDSGELYPEKAGKLVSGCCEAILPMSMIHNGESKIGIYNTDGYKQLSSMENINASEILLLAKKVLIMRDICSDYLFFPEEYILSTETVYLSEDNDNVKLTYIPICDRISGDKSMIYFLRQLMRHTTENGQQYLETLLRFFLCENMREEQTIGFIEKLRYEIYTCGII